LLGLPVLTADYDFWLAIDDISIFNAFAAQFELRPTHTPEEARQHGRYVLENDERLVTREEVREALDRPISTAEREEVISLVRWFTTRYPTAEARLAYVTQAYARWRRARDRSTGA
jgi:hypothetical protein